MTKHDEFDRQWRPPDWMMYLTGTLSAFLLSVSLTKTWMLAREDPHAFELDLEKVLVLQLMESSREEDHVH